MPLQLIVMRHAKSSWKNPDQTDHERPLNGRGRKAAPAIAAALARQGWIPDLVLSSDSLRTRQTWQAMEDTLETDHVVFTRDLYHAGFAQAGAELASHGNGASCVLLLGHNPGWESMLYELTGEYMALKTADAVLLEHPSDDWAEAFFGGRWTIQTIVQARIESP
jgi:phosphohistidine phosphatase